MTPEEKKRKFEEAIIDMAVVEHHRYCMTFKRAKSEKDAHMFYTALKIGVDRGKNFMAHQIVSNTKQYEQSLKNFEEKKNGNN